MIGCKVTCVATKGTIAPEHKIQNNDLSKDMDAKLDDYVSVNRTFKFRAPNQRCFIVYNQFLGGFNLFGKTSNQWCLYVRFLTYGRLENGPICKIFGEILHNVMELGYLKCLRKITSETMIFKGKSNTWLTNPQIFRLRRAQYFS